MGDPTDGGRVRSWMRARSGKTGFRSLFDGRSIEQWEMVGDGRFVIVDGRLESIPSDDVGLFWCTVPTPPNFLLRLHWLRWRHEDTAGVFVRFPRPVAADARQAAAAAAKSGFEVQIDEIAARGSALQRTGAILGEPGQRLAPRPARPAAEWNHFEIAVQDQQYDVWLNGARVTTFVNTDTARGRPSAPAAPRFVGLRLCPGSRVAFRDIRIKPL